MTQHNPASSHLHSIDGVCDRLALKRSQVYKLIAAGQLRSVRVGKRRLIPDGAIAEFIAALEAESGAA